MSQYKILLVEDDLELSKMICDFLSRIGGYVVEVTDNGQTACRMIDEQTFDLVILDLMLPGLDGMGVCRYIRKEHNVPITILSAKDDEFIETATLSLGADNYLKKPISPHLLLAHIEALIRRSTDQATSSESMINIHRQSREVFLGDREVALTGNEYKILDFLMENMGEIVTRDDLFKELRGLPFDGEDRVVDLLISSLRKKLGDLVAPYRFIKTIRGQGYLFAAQKSSR